MLPELDTSKVLYSTFGRCAYSHRPSPPCYTFTMADLDARALQYLGSELTKRQTELAVSPGPAAYSPFHSCSANGPGAMTNIRWGLDGTQKEPYGRSTHTHAAPPGPGSHMNSTSLTGVRHLLASRKNARSVGWQCYSSRINSLALHLGGDGLDKERLGFFSPGPATVGREAFSSVGPQANSQKITSPRFAMPRGPRFEFVSKGADTHTWPGPGSYEF